MKGILLILRYFLTWQPWAAWIFVLGVALLVASIPAALLYDPHFAFGLSIYGYILALVLPCLAVCVPFRKVIANARLAMIPGLPLRAGLALLALTLLLALFLPLSSLLYWPGAVPPGAAAGLFVYASLYIFLGQWLLTTRYLIWAISIGPFILVYLLARFKDEFGPWLQDPAFFTILVILTCAGWAFGLRELARRRHFKPTMQLPQSNLDMSGSTGWATPLPQHIGKPGTPAGTLLYGFPDSLANRIYQTVNLVVISPLTGVLLLYLIGIGAYPEGPRVRMDYPGLFLLFSLVTAIITSFNNGELAARCRLLWLRRGGDRRVLWRFMEGTLLKQIALTYALVLLVAVGATLLDSVGPISPAEYLVLGVCCSLLGSYASLAMRVSSWSTLIRILFITLLGPGVAFGFLFARAAITAPVFYALLLTLALLLRWHAHVHFMSIDWLQVRLRTLDRRRDAGAAPT